MSAQCEMPIFEVSYPEDLYPKGLKPAQPGDAGIDLRSPIDFCIHPGEEITLDTEVKLSFPDSGLVGLVFPRSSFGSRGLTLINTVGVADSSYQGSILLFLANRSINRPISVTRGERIVQVVFVPYVVPIFAKVKKFSIKTSRGDKGHGSTGR